MQQARIFFGIFFSVFLLVGLLWILPLPATKKANASPQKSPTLPAQYAEWHYWDSLSHIKTYELACQKVLDTQAELAQAYLDATPAERKNVIEKAKMAIFQGITQDILPFWNETEWDFNGITKEPTKGVIACGYFVATILQQAGIQLDRRKMGQSSSTDLVKTLCDSTSIQSFKKKNFQGLWKYLSQKAPDGLYIIGLDKHTGLIAKQKGKITFIHSRKPRLAGVIFENAQKSLTLHNSSVHVVGNVLSNQALILKWLGE